MLKKMEAGCRYFLTQPVYDKEGIERLTFLKERTGAKILIGIMPLVSRRNALFIKNEMPGIHVMTPFNRVSLVKSILEYV